MNKLKYNSWPKILYDLEWESHGQKLKVRVEVLKVYMFTKYHVYMDYNNYNG